MGAGHLRSARPAPTRRDPPLPLASSNPGHKPAPSPLAHHHHPTHSSYCTLEPPPSRYPGPPTVWRLERFHARTHARQVILGDSQDPTQLQGQPRGPWDPRAPAHYSDTRVRDTHRSDNLTAPADSHLHDFSSVTAFKIIIGKLEFYA